jgi:hypothetical protein
MLGEIYLITCNSSGLKYIGQATKLKYKNDKPYNYGALGRWSDHVSSSKNRTTPLCEAIQLYGKDDFKIEVLEEGPLISLDEREAYYMIEYNSIHPNGYNVASHSRNRHRETSNLHVFYENKVKCAVISPIRKNGELRFAYVYLTLNDDTKERIAFGQKMNNSFEDTMNEVMDFINHLQCSYSTSYDYSDVFTEKYATKIKQFDEKVIVSVKIKRFSGLIAVYIGTSDMVFNREHKRICFGGKKITEEDAYKNARQFIEELQISNEIVEDFIKG